MVLVIYILNSYVGQDVVVMYIHFINQDKGTMSKSQMPESTILVEVKHCTEGTLKLP